MLKIKDNIDLKELEKFGFNKTIINFLSDGHVGIELYDNKYYKSIFTLDNKGLDTLYGLIKADLVEKVEEV